MKPSVCVVVVTYGKRWHFLSQVLSSLCNQRYRPSIVVVVDNGTGYLNKHLLSIFDLNISLIQLDVNNGSAIGFRLGIMAASNLKVDLIWLLDDDNKPEETALEEAVELFTKMKTPIASKRIMPGLGIRVPAQLSKNGFLNFNILDSLKALICDRGNLFSKSQSSQSEACDGGIETVPVTSYGGFLIPVQTVNKIGLPREDFVTYADDTEWTARIGLTGEVIYRCVKSVIVDLDPSWNIRNSRLNPLVSNESGLYRIYYGVRNQTYLEYRNALSKPLYFLNMTIRAAVLIANFVLFSPQKLKSLLRFHVLLRAVSDGIKGHLGSRPKYEYER